MRQSIDIQSLPDKLFFSDPEILQYVDTIHQHTDELDQLTVCHLPNFELFLHTLPDDVDLDSFAALLRQRPIQIRLLTMLKFIEYGNRPHSDSETYHSFKDFLVYELIDQSVGRIHYLDR